MHIYIRLRILLIPILVKRIHKISVYLQFNKYAYIRMMQLQKHYKERNTCLAADEKAISMHHRLDRFYDVYLSIAF